MRVLLIILVALVHLFAQEALCEASYWKKLLHYKNHQNRVLSKEFFLSGKENPSLEEELNATIEAFSGAEGEKAACRFPARYEWLKTKVTLPAYDLGQCEDLQKYYDGFPHDEFDIVYMSGLSDSVASSFGHSYLLFKDRNSSYDSAQSIDISVKTQNDNFFQYIYGGLTGKYSTYYKRDTFYGELNDAIRKERYLLFNKLDLGKSEIRTLIYHLYEMENVKLIYYYQNGNCTSNINDLLSLVKESAYETNIADVPSELYKIYQHKISKTGSITLSDYDYPYPYDGFTIQEKKNYLKAIYVTKNINVVHKVKFSDVNKTTNLKLIDPSSFSLGAYDRKLSSGYLASYIWYDKKVHDRYSGFEQKMDLSLLKLELNVEKDNLKVNRFDLAKFNKHSFNEKVSIHIHSGLNRENESYKLRYENEFGLGIPMRLTDNFVFNVSLNGGLENLDVYAKPNVSACYTFNPNNTLDMSYYHKLYGNDFHQAEIEYTSKIGDFSLVGRYIKNNGEEDNRVSLSLGYSF